MFPQTSDSHHKANERGASRWRRLMPALAMALLTSCIEAPASRDTPSLLDAHGEGARIISQEWQLLFWIGTAIVLLISALLIAILIRHLRTPREVAADPRETVGVRWIWLGGIALPAVILVFTFFSTVRGSGALSAPPNPETVTINITGHRWWWEVQYPDAGITTANQLYVPVGQSVRIHLESDDVIHSFWVPQLHFKRDLIPGQPNSTWLQADEPGVYRGICSEFCGVQHAQMMFMVVALEPDRYQAWIENEGRSAVAPEDDVARAGQQVFLSSACIYCHTIRGTPAAGETGPDLTHLASRQTIAAGALENNIGNLGGWIMDPQHIKPGSAMPATPLNGDELQALLAYLTTLK
ncbi:MAG: cytochrome c oxidase subunit II [Caldilineaceae bacterium]|nr:cytochrome c oxidase subunit II [Caldilineaceae bacterium]